MNDQPIWLTFLVAFIIMNVLLIGMAYMTYFERKVLAAMQDRMGPTRTGPKGLLQPIADGIKLLGKEDLIPAQRGQVGLLLRAAGGFRLRDRVGAPSFRLVDTINVFGRDINLYATDLNVGALFVMAVSGIGVYGIILGAWASANRFSLLGGLRAAAQVVSYELILGLSLAGIFLLAGSLSLRDIVDEQQQNLEHRSAGDQELVHLQPAPRLRDFPDRRGCGNEPRPLRPSRSRDRARFPDSTPSTRPSASPSTSWANTSR